MPLPFVSSAVGAVVVLPPHHGFFGFSSRRSLPLQRSWFKRRIVESGVLTGMGKFIAKHAKSVNHQVAALAGATWLLSSFMNNVGAVGMTLPTAQRMARRENIARSQFGYPIAGAAILGGAATLIGTAPNLIVSSYRMQASGLLFACLILPRMVLVLALAGVLVWFICRVFSI